MLATPLTTRTTVCGCPTLSPLSWSSNLIHPPKIYPWSRRASRANIVRLSPMSRSPASADSQGPWKPPSTEAGQTNGTPRMIPSPSDEILSVWCNADAVCFDVDCTVTKEDSLDLLAQFMGVRKEVAELTRKADQGIMGLEDAHGERLRILNCAPSDIKHFILQHPPQSRLTPGIKELITALHARGVAVYLISGGFRELMLPIAKHLGVPTECVYANRMMWQYDNDTGEPTRVVGFDIMQPTAHLHGKPQAIARIRERNPYNSIVMVGDDVSDLEAVQETGGADLFIGFGGVVHREAVAQGADWFIEDWGALLSALKRYQVAMVGSGAWACAALHMVAQNLRKKDPAHQFMEEVKMWVFEEDWQGGKLSEAINCTHQNPKYLPGIDLGSNVRAVTDLVQAVQDADIIIICAPHQFVHGICRQLRGQVKPDCIGISLTKGMRVRPEGPQLVSAMVRRYLGIDCSVLMGANLAEDTAREELSEAVIGYTIRSNAELLRKLFQTNYFYVSLTPDVVGAEMCGTLKNIVAVASGLIDGLGLGPNSKAAIMRQGLYEMRMLSKALYPTVRDEAFFQSCGIGDLIATCYGGRNRRVAEEYAKRWKAGRESTFQELEVELLKGQKLQGTLTSDEVSEILKARGWERDYPLFTCVNLIINRRLPPSAIVCFREATLETEVEEGGGRRESQLQVLKGLEDSML